MFLESIIVSTIGIIFFYINTKVIYSDVKYKKIPNKYLGYLLLLVFLWGSAIFFGMIPENIIQIGEIDFGAFSLQVIMTFVVSFIFYYFGIWAAGDAKYLLVLSLFIPYIGIIPFIGNIAVLTLICLFLYFVYFYMGRLSFQKEYRKDLLQNIKIDLNQKWETHKGGDGGNTYRIILKFLIVFLVIFVSIRLCRIYLLNKILEDSANIEFISEIIQKYNVYLMILGIGIFIGSIFLFKKMIQRFTEFVNRRGKINKKLIGDVLLSILSALLIAFISYELMNDYSTISTLLFKIFTLYLIIYIIIKIIIYSYKITFGVGEVFYKNIRELQEGDIIDKSYLIKMFHEQKALGFVGAEPTKKMINESKECLLYPSPLKYFQSLDTTMDEENVILLKQIYSITNTYHIKNKTPHYHEVTDIKVLHTFAFAPYLLTGFIITFFMEDKIFIFLAEYIISLLKSLY